MLFSNVKTADEALKKTFALTASYTEFYTDFSALVIAERSEKDGYTITATDNGYTISYKHIYDFYAGYLYLCANADTIEHVQRKRAIDQFGVMPAISAGGVPKIETLKRLIVQSACMGYNFLELSLDDCVEVDGEPYYGYLRGRYTKDDLKSLVAFAAAYEMEVVPSVQTLGHFELMLQHPVYGKIKDAPAVLLCKEEESYALIEKIIKTCRECFTTERINICFDEAHEVGLGAYLQKHGFENRIDILLDHLARVKEICKKYGFKPAMWSDMFFRLEFNSYFAPDGTFSQETVQKIPQDVDLIYWDYYRPVEWCYDKILGQHEQLTSIDKIQFAGGVWTFNGFAPILGFTEKSMLAAIAMCKKHKVQRFIMTAWGDDCSECSFNEAFASFALLAEANYVAEPNKESVSHIVEILSGYTSDEWRLLEAPNDLFGEYYPTIGNPSKYFLYQDALLGRFDLYVRKTDKKKFQTAHKKLSALAQKNHHYSFFFDMIAKLSKVLYLKADVGVQIRRAYENGDKQALSTHARVLRKTVKAVQEFYESFVKAWEMEKKSAGLEIHDARLGGLQNRLLHVAKRIESYVKGELAELDELKEEILYFNPKDGENDVEYNRAILYQGLYRTITTVGRL